MVPKPTLSLTLPSLKDETVLDCRVYLPTTLYDGTTSMDSSSRSSTADDETQRERTRGELNGEARASDNYRWTIKRKKAAIIAHPYAPLGGSCEDYIVQQTAGIFLKEGFVVGLFNFRGASTSKGKTSWNGKPEVCDYHSMVGFMTVFMHHLNLEPASPTSSVLDTSTYELMTIPSQLPANPVSAPPARPTTYGASTNRDSASVDNIPLLLLAGYSYGSLITTMLPPLPTLLTPFQSPLPGTTASEIRLRAQHLAEEQNTLHSERLKRASEAASRRHHARNVSSGIRVGGDEAPLDVHHRTSLDSHHGRRSLRLEKLEHSDWGRKSVEKVRSLRKSLDGHHFSPPSSPRQTSYTERRANSSSATIDTPGGPSMVVSPEEASEAAAATAAAVPMPHLEFGELAVAYLLISPIQGVVGGLATMFTSTSAKSLLPTLSFRKHAGSGVVTAGDRKFVENKTLVVFGNKDSFSNADRMRKWTHMLEGAKGSRFRAVEVNNGGHFWHEMEELETLKRSVEGWARELG
ncbi:hypothetical protein V492_07563 [Pseudogymnoascus sp. VKM F-4246]|nr:hypothetical protein V492_07563 [Pseudogymnoascus sp. VKM F-4246]